ncbi:hypothetical protein H310_04757 [Aphanomyces invadans]|uniref:Poly A polymerase head domain-containing protein n=1 Tax=Aphanomyces invadans TaxID=157072 RepID=A0A024UE06_9STRA|nr:hypothetical protein H310_04757 [Aphanomyces invadans]ETW04494.1 hypothetical protein H310_04757 [Aphanomyces invadans]|eukprot:XP_008867450.1 hypothetical protein H310_04757 [Aphanomyces invadans]
MLLARRRHQVLLPIARHSTVFQRWQSRKSDSGAVEIQLTPAEEKLFEVLQFVRKKYAPSTTLRVAGGWVRDKVLGIPSDDIDIALDTVTGEAFVKKIVAFQKACGVPIKGFYIVKKNAEQSKHLECAAIKLLGQELDFVHLRSETYNNPNSRIPTLSGALATPKEDAMRRDITINALFYNLNTKTVEDFTGQGLLDLDRQIIRTPLAPTETFLDDPLRVLRAIRFASHYNFQLHSSIVQAMQTEPVQMALAQKVTRERVGIEVRKMLSGTNPAQALHWMRQTNLLQIVLPTFLRVPLDDSTVDATIRFVQATVAKASNVSYPTKDQFDHRVMLASALAPTRTWFTPADVVGSNDDTQPELAVANSAKRGEMMSSMLRCLREVVFPIFQRSPPVNDDVEPSQLSLCHDAAVVQSALAFLSHSNKLDKQHQPRQRWEAIKRDLKWSNVDAKHTSDVIEGCRRFEELAAFLLQTQSPAEHDCQPHTAASPLSNAADELQMVVALCLWCHLHGSGVLHHMLPILWHFTYGCDGQAKDGAKSQTPDDGTALRALLASAESIASDKTWQRTVLPAPEVQAQVKVRKGSKWQLSDVLRVVAVWEWLHPSASMEQERDFVRSVLAPVVTGSAKAA